MKSFLSFLSEFKISTTKAFRNFILFISFFTLLSNSANSQVVVSTSVSWTTGWCNICGPTTGNYACAQGSGSGNWNNGIRPFNVVIPPGNVVTGVCITVNKVDCGLTSMCVNINGTNIGCQNVPGGTNCNCGACWPMTICNTFPCPTGLPGFNYAGVNNLQIVNTGNLCVNNAVITLTYQACCLAPTITAVANPTAVCPGFPSQLTGGGAGIGGTYTWTPGNLVGQSVNVTPAVTTIYTVVGTSTTGCFGTKTVQVVVNPTPTIIATPNPSAICIGQSANVAMSGAFTYTTNVGNMVGNNIVVSPTVTTIYTVTGTSNLGCVGTKTFQVIVNPLPVVNPASNSPICSGGTLNLSVGASSSYTWTGPNAFTSNLQNPTIGNVTPSLSGVYTVSVTNVNGCVGVGSTTVIVNPTPTISPTNGGPYCSNATISLSVAANSSYTWTGPNAFTSNLQNPTIANGQTVNAGVYTVTVTAVGGCVSTGTTNVIVNPTPTITAVVNPTAICIGQIANVSLSGANTYTTNPGNIIGSTFTLSPAVTTVYTVSGTSAANCVGTRTFQLIVNPLPVIVVSTSVACLNQNLFLAASGGTAYAWSGPLGFVSAVQNPTLANAQLNMNGAYTVVVTSAFGCTASAVINATVITLPQPTIVSTPTICVGNTLNFTGSGGSGYSWSGPNGFASPFQNPTIPGVSLAATGLYTLVVTAGTCSNSTTFSVTVIPLPTPTAISNSPVCLLQPINFTGSGGTTYTWTGPGLTSNNQNTVIASAQGTNAGTYTLSVTVNGCTNFTTTNVTINSLPVIAVSTSVACLNQNLFLAASGGTAYAWSGPLGFVSAVQNPTLANAQLNMNGAYTVVVTSAQGCTASAVINATVITLPQPTIVSTPTICVGNTLNFTGSGGSGYSWSGPNGFASPFQNPTIPGVSLAATGLYTLVVTAGTCSNSTTFSVTVIPLPTPTAVSNSPVCLLQPINFTGSGGTTYTWTGPGLASNLQNPVIGVAQGTNAGTYTLSVTVNGCTNFTTTNVTINSLPVIAVSTSVACLNQNLFLAASGGTAYAWSGPLGFVSAVQNPTLANAQLNMNGPYTVVVTSAQGCTASAVINATVITLPVANIISNSPVCFGSVLSFTGSGGAFYNWSGPNGFASGFQNPTIPGVSLAANGIYTLVVTAGTCSNSTTASVTVNPLPVATATSNSAVCVNQSINFTGGGGNSYSWTGPGGFTSNQQNPLIAVAQSSNAGNYVLIITDVNTCTNTASTNVVVNALPVVTSGNHVVCVNTTINLFANGANAYSWSGPNGFTSLQQNPSIPLAQMSMNGQYIVIGTSAQNCTNSAVSNVTVLPLPTPLITSNSPVCIGAALNLNGTGGSSYAWTGPNGFNSNSQNPNIPNTTLAASGNYILIISVGNCTASTSSAIVINPLPSPTITSNSPVCLSQPINFIASGGNSYTWAGPNGYTGSGNNPVIPTASNLNAGTYTATATDANNCTNTVVTTVSINPLPVIAAVGSTLCAEKTMSLSASGGTAYIWSGPNGFSSASPSAQVPDATTSMSGQYTVTATDLNGCSSTSMTNVQVNTIPVVTVNVNTPVCANQTINLSAGSVTGLYYVWSGPNGFTSTKQNPELINVGTNATGLYTVSVTDNIGCSTKATIPMIVNPLPVVSISSDKTRGCVPVCITFSPQSTVQLQNCFWQFGDGTTGAGLVVEKCYKNAGGYDISTKFSDINGCSNTATFNVEAYPIPVADFNFAPTKPVVNESIEFSDASYGANVTGWTWSFSHLQNKIVLNPVTTLAYENAGTYVTALIVISDKGCKDTIVKPITVGEDFGIYVPDAFSPNGDGVNDIFQPKGFGIVKYELNVYDRWGEKMFSSKDFEQGWDGTFPRRTNEIIKDDVYVWNIKVVSVFGKQKEYTGHVTLLK